jgi:hypothetical protein
VTIAHALRQVHPIQSEETRLLDPPGELSPAWIRPIVVDANFLRELASANAQPGTTTNKGPKAGIVANPRTIGDEEARQLMQQRDEHAAIRN